MTHKYFLQFLTIIQMVLDFITVIASFLLGYYIYHFLLTHWGIGTAVQPFKIYRNLSLGAAVLFLILFERFGLYSRQSGVLNVEEMKRILQSLLLGSLILFSISFLLRPIMTGPSPIEINHGALKDGKLTSDMTAQGVLLYSRLILMYSLVTLFILINFQRHIMNRLLLKFHIKGPGLYRVLIYGAGEVGKQLLHRLFENPRIGLKPVGFIDDDMSKVGESIYGLIGQEDSAVKVLGNGLQLEELVRSWNVHEVIIAIPTASTERIYEIINSCIKAGVRFSFVPNLFDMFIQQVRFEEIEGVPLLRMKSVRRSYIYLAAKRIFDITFSTFCLLVSLPFWPVIALLIKIDSPGPVLFVQDRVGKDGRLFKIYKFRTMRADSNKYMDSPKKEDDPRITRIGRWLRRYSIDEIPQFWNVLKGDMSVVGPRPEMPFVVENYTPFQRERLKVRPGITGIWQISAARDMDIHENLDYDYYYTENQSFLLDLVIIAKTLASAFTGKGL